MNVEIILSITGWIGTFFYIMAYLLLTIRMISPSSFTYHFLNIVGASGLIANAIHFQDNANIIVNAVWLTIALAAIAISFSKNIQMFKVSKKKEAANMEMLSLDDLENESSKSSGNYLV